MSLLLAFSVLLCCPFLTQGQHHQHVGHHNNAAAEARHDLHRHLCSDVEMQFQFDNTDLVIADICDTDTPWKLAQLALPEASTFIDIGGNRGYTSAMFFGLWSPGHGLNRLILKQLTLAAGPEVKQQDTVCGDGQVNDQPLFCPGLHKYQAGLRCQFRRSIRVFAFDGQEAHVKSVSKIISSNFPLLSSQNRSRHSFGKVLGSRSTVKATFEYVHAALSNEKEVNANGGKGHFLIADREGGSLNNAASSVNSSLYQTVNLTTVDAFCTSRGLQSVDILKIDAENHDLEVVQGAFETIKTRGVKLLTFECFYCLREEMRKLFAMLDTDYGFECYANGQQDIMIKITNCWNFTLSSEEGAAKASRKICTNDSCGQANANKPEKRLDGNIYCVHRMRATALHLLYESRSLYKYSLDVDGTRHGHVIADAVLSFPGVFNGDVLTIEPGETGKWERRTGRTIDGDKQWW